MKIFRRAGVPAPFTPNESGHNIEPPLHFSCVRHFWRRISKHSRPLHAKRRCIAISSAQKWHTIFWNFTIKFCPFSRRTFLLLPVQRVTEHAHQFLLDRTFWKCTSAALSQNNCAPSFVQCIPLVFWSFILIYDLFWSFPFIPMPWILEIQHMWVLTWVIPRANMFCTG